MSQTESGEVRPSESEIQTVRIFDTTLRDGEQSPGATMNQQEKLQVAEHLARMGVNVIEAGFPASSPGDFESVQRIAAEIPGPTIVGLARTNPDDIRRCWDAVKGAASPGIHTFIATSDVHLQYKLRKTKKEVLRDVVEMVGLAASLSPWVEFSAEDATRSDWTFLAEVFDAAIEAGARTINVPDTVGYTVPWEYARLIEYLRAHVPNVELAVVSVHCHNDLGMATANSLAAVKAGARQVECTINGIGERAGNTAMEEIVMALKTRRAEFGCDTTINTRMITGASRMVSYITGFPVQPNKAIVGANAFAHEAGIHQDGVLKHALTYEIMTAESVGLTANRLVLGKHSGRAAFRDRIASLGYELPGPAFEEAFRRFKELADKKKTIYDEDIVAIVSQELSSFPERLKLEYITISSGSQIVPSATIQMTVDGEVRTEAGFGDGPVDAAFSTIRKIVGTEARLLEYSVSSITGGSDAQGGVSVKVEEDDYVAYGHASDPDIIVASAKAFVNALNRLLHRMETGARRAEGV